ncbi:MAG: hypothetical protein NZ551_07885 [Microscillaceae bacterium]|nr:hypothetical protein [Microscillaceae bacterium]MDW8461116.1 hypothetical protein [Cytophagales bacterium]
MEKNKVFENEILQIYHYPQEDILEMVWTSQPNTPQQQIREACLAYLEQQKRYKSKFNIVNTQNAGYVIVPEDQDWINTHIAPEAWKAGMRAAAYIMPEDFFMGLSIEQLSEDASLNAETRQVMIQQQYFKDIQSALKWFSSLKEKEQV